MKNFRHGYVAYLRPLPRTHPQKQRVQTHSRGRAKRSSHDENFTTFLLLELFSFLFHLHNVNSEKEESCQGKRLSE